MTKFEAIYRSVRLFDHPLYQRVFGTLKAMEAQARGDLRILDVGGRRSNYTIGLKSRICISDIPPAGALQSQLDLGATEETRRRVLGRRSNVDDYIIDDMTRTSLAPGSFDAIVAVEVLEHVDEDDAFVRNVASVLRPGGTFVMTTPNGDFLPVPYPDHKRHYKRAELARLLGRHFRSADVSYAVNAGRLIKMGVHRPSVRTPIATLLSPPSLFLSYRFEQLGIGGEGPEGKRHLFAVARKN